MTRWPADVKARALELYVERGGDVAARETGVPVATIRSWACRNGLAQKRAAAATAHVEAASLRWAERRAVMVDEIGAAARLALEQTVNALDTAKSRDAKDFATTLGILIDKAQLLGGDATSRHEVADARRRMAEVRDQLAERRAERAAA